MKILNIILAIILFFSLTNLYREYTSVSYSKISNTTDGGSLPLDFNIHRNNWSYYSSAFTIRGYKSVSSPISSRSLHLPFILKGTIISTPKNSYAIIENLDTSQQSLYRLNSVIMGARIVSMSRNRIIVEYNGTKQELRTQGKSPLPIHKKTTYLKKPIVDFNKILTQIRIKPYFEDGRCTGFQLDNVRNGSFVQQMGLKKGDIIEKINGTQINDPLKALQILYKIRENNPVHLGIERKEKKMELDCKVEG